MTPALLAALALHLASAPTPEGPLEVQAVCTVDPGGVNRNRRAGLAAYLALESPSPAQTVAALKALIREVAGQP